jgi:hypothetical protein
MKDEEKVRKELSDILNNAKSIKDIIDFPSLIDDYIEEGYNVKDYIHKYNLRVQEFLSKK